MATAAVLLEQLARRVARTPAHAPLSSRLLSAYVVMTGVDGGAVSIGTTIAARSSLAATDAFAERLEDLQEVLREGPALEAVRTGAPVGLDGDEAHRRWPLLERSMREGGTVARMWLAAIPMRPASEVIGAITVYRLDAQGLSLDGPDTTFLADAVGAAILGGLERADDSATSWGVRDRIDQATGMVMAQLHLQPRDARALLGAHAYASGTSLAAAADAVLSRSLDFRDEADDADEEGELVMEERIASSTFADVVSAMTRRYDTGDVLDALVGACRDGYPAAAVAVLAGEPTGELQLMSATSHRADELELLQLQQGTGPCLEAMRTGLAMRAGTEEVTRRWPPIGAAMDRAGYSGIHAYPMTWRGRPVGGLNVFLGPDHVETAGDGQLGQLYADLATLAVAHAGDRGEDSVTGQVQDAIKSRSVVEQAKGVLAYQRGVSPAAAYELLRDRARDEGAPLSAVAHDVVTSVMDPRRR